ncbi:hypothetical protein BDQ12DRAFT_692930 [Crucibulum laeve]|uniref:Uncharacterized protein n=1 Tax=Crucibulum laeve TaxID=68775 RepID=A0A5C3LHL7_9AGAR|nr:hypothetical protein BDQ12DRAFT_692930 [Crucibulum laeve]
MFSFHIAFKVTILLFFHVYLFYFSTQCSVFTRHLSLSVHYRPIPTVTFHLSRIQLSTNPAADAKMTVRMTALSSPPILIGYAGIFVRVSRRNFRELLS